MTAFSKEHFVAVNGFSNDYWGWGCEDLDLRFRCHCRGLSIAKRDGTFRALPHAHNGFVAPGVRSPQAAATHALLEARLPSFRESFLREGLSTLEMTLEWTRAIDGEPGAQGLPRALHHGVSIGTPLR